MHGVIGESRVLLQESDGDLSRVVAESLEQQGWEVVEAVGAELALDALSEVPHPAVLIVEYGAEGDSAQRLIDRYRAASESNGKVLVTTEHRPPDAWRRSVRPDTVIYKPFDTRYLVKSINALTGHG